MDLVSIIIPYYNKKNFISLAINIVSTKYEKLLLVRNGLYIVSSKGLSSLIFLLKDKLFTYVNGLI